MKIKLLTAAALTLAAVGAAQAQDVIAVSNNPWEGFFAGANIGGAWNHTCESWEPGNAIKSNPTLANAFYNRDCPNNGNFIGGVDVGYNFQYRSVGMGLQGRLRCRRQQDQEPLIRLYQYWGLGSFPERHV